MFNQYAEDYKDQYVYVECMDDMKMKMKNVLAIVYGNSDIEDLEFELEGLANHLGMKLPSEPFKLKRT